MSGNWTLPYPRIIHQTGLAATGEKPWHIAKYEIDTKLHPKYKGKGMVIGVVDTGISQTHVEKGQLQGRLKKAKDFTKSRYGEWGDNPHGTHVSGILLGNLWGILPEAMLVSGKALGDGGTGSDQSVIQAMKFCADEGARVINMSLGSPEKSDAIEGLMRELHQQGIIIGCAAGNDSGRPNWPGRSEHGICWSASDQNEMLAMFSCYGPEVDAVAPGVEIRSLGRGGTEMVMSGTSQACPFGMGVIAARIGYGEKIGWPIIKTVDQAIDWMASTFRDVGDKGRDDKFGVGMPNVDKVFAGAPATQPGQPQLGRVTPTTSMLSLSDGTNWLAKFEQIK